MSLRLLHQLHWHTYFSKILIHASYMYPYKNRAWTECVSSTWETKHVNIQPVSSYIDCENNINVKNWCSLLTQLLCTLGFYEVWLFQEVGNVSVFLFNVKQRLSDQFIQGWDGRLNISSRASLYKCISSFKFKPYLDICNIPKFRYS